MKVISPVEGIVQMFYADDGTQVAHGDRLIGVESMKTTIDAISPGNGRLRLICHLGAYVRRSQVLAEVL